MKQLISIGLMLSLSLVSLAQSPLHSDEYNDLDNRLNTCADRYNASLVLTGGAIVAGVGSATLLGNGDLEPAIMIGGIGVVLSSVSFVMLIRAVQALKKAPDPALSVDQGEVDELRRQNEAELKRQKEAKRAARRKK